MKKFEVIFKRAVKRKGGEEALLAVMPAAPVSSAALSRKKGHRFLAEMSRSIFQSGFNWKVVENKWPDIEAALDKFDVGKAASMDEGDLSKLVADPRVIRHRGKLEAIRSNARFIIEVEGESGSFGKMLARWPSDDLVGLWATLQTRGSRLGGATGQYFLRSVGKDTFMLTRDVVKCLVDAGVVDKKPTSKRDLAATQAAFNQWHAESGRPMAELSRICACSVD